MKLAESVEGIIIWNRNWRRGGGDCFDTPFRGSQISSALAASFQVGANVWGQVVEKEPLEHEALGFMDSMIQR